MFLLVFQQELNVLLIEYHLIYIREVGILGIIDGVIFLECLKVSFQWITIPLIDSISSNVLYKQTVPNEIRFIESVLDMLHMRAFSVGVRKNLYRFCIFFLFQLHHIFV